MDEPPARGRVEEEPDEDHHRNPRLAHRDCGSTVFDRSLGDYFLCNVMMNLLLGLET